MSHIPTLDKIAVWERLTTNYSHGGGGAKDGLNTIKKRTTKPSALRASL